MKLPEIITAIHNARTLTGLLATWSVTASPRLGFNRAAVSVALDAVLERAAQIYPNEKHLDRFLTRIMKP